MKDNLGAVFGIGILLFVAWIFFGGLLESDKYDQANTVHIDCTNAGYANSPYCNGEYESQMRDEAGMENAYYQNMGH